MKLLLLTAISLLFFISATSFAETALKPNDRIIFLGDSITQAGARGNGYVNLVSQEIKKKHADLNIEIIGAGISGNRVDHCLKRLNRDVLKKDPTIVVIYIGINDVWHWFHPRVQKRGGKGTTPEEFDAGLREMITKIEAKGARVILCTPTVIGEKIDGSNELDKQLDQYSDISRKVAKETNSQLLDLRKKFLDYLKKHNPDNAEKGILTSDRVHLNEKGNRVLADFMLESLQTK